MAAVGQVVDGTVVQFCSVVPATPISETSSASTAVEPGFAGSYIVTDSVTGSAFMSRSWVTSTPPAMVTVADVDPSAKL